jgi:pilus assembly protein Flp/PilA
LPNFQDAVTTDETGATAVEYGLLVALIAAIIIALVIVLGQEVNNAFNSMIGRF